MSSATTARHLRPTAARPHLTVVTDSVIAAHLRNEIHLLAVMIAFRNGRTPKAVEKGLWFWYGPPYREFENIDVLRHIHADAVRLLAGLVPPDPNDSHELAEGP